MTLSETAKWWVKKTICTVTEQKRLILGRLDLPEMDIG